MPDIHAWPRFHHVSHTKLLIVGFVKAYSGVFIATHSLSVPFEVVLFWMKLDGAGAVPPLALGIFLESISKTSPLEMSPPFQAFQ